VTAADLEGLSFAELEDELARLASHIFAGTCRWLELVAELERRGGLSGCTTAEWLAWRCGLTPRTAREHVRVALRLVELPCIRAAFAVGELSYAKVRALTRIAEPESEEELLELARHLTAAQLDRAVRAYRRVTTDQAAALQDAAYLGWCWDEDGSLVLRGRLAPEEGAVFLEALEAGARQFGSVAATWSAVPRNRGRRMPRRSPPRPNWLSRPPARLVRAANGTRLSSTSTTRRSRAKVKETASSPKARRSRRRRRAGSPATPPCC